MKGRFEASWRIVLALAVVLSLGLMTAGPAAAVSFTSPPGVVLSTCKAGTSANYTLYITIAKNLTASNSSIFVYFPTGTDLSSVSGAQVNGAAAASYVAQYYVITELPELLVLNITVNQAYDAMYPLQVDVYNVTNPCTIGSKTLKVWTTYEPTAVTSPAYTICVGDAASIVVTPNPATGQCCVNTTFTITPKDSCGNNLPSVNITAGNWTVNTGPGSVTFYAGNKAHTCTNGTYNITANYTTLGGVVQNWTTWNVTVGAAAKLVFDTNPTSGSPYACCANITAVLNVTDACNNTVSGVAVTASASGPGALTGTKTATTNSSGQATFNNLVLCTNGTYNLTFTAGSLSANATGIGVNPGPADHLVLAPCPSSIVVNTTKTFTADVYDKCGNLLATGVAFNVTIPAGVNATAAGNGTATVNITPLACDIWTLTGWQNTTVNGTCALTVTHAACPVSISISPAAVSIESGNSQQFIATATDVFGCIWDATTDPGTTWSINLSCAGGSWASLYPGKYNSEHTGCFNVTVTLCGVSDTAYLTVTPSMCFIATATYGTPMAQEIQILRAFRDGYLLTNPVGRALVAFYYKTSPPIAQFIAEHPSLKPIVRAMLVPALAMSTIVVNNGVTLPLIVLGLVLIAVALAIWATRRRGRGPSYA
jgi:hypothetical protein